MEHNTLSDGAKLTYALILGLSNRYGYCFATNSALAEMRNTSESSLKRHIKELLDNKVLEAEYNKRNDRRLRPIVIPAQREKLLKSSKNVEFAQYDDATNDALDEIWMSMR
jgi:DNA-binding MarR family transcriptional regulator